MNFVVTAFLEEARPFIEELGLQPVDDSEGFRCFTGERVELVLSGMGADNSARAVRYLRKRQSAGGDYHWINFGIAGSSTFDPGTLVAAARVTRLATSEAWDCRPASWIGLPRTRVFTVDEPERVYSQEGVYDMEAAGFAGEAIATGAGSLVTIIKLVSDGPDRPVDTLQPADFREMIAPVRKHLRGWLLQPRT